MRDIPTVVQCIGDKERRGDKIFDFSEFLKFLVGHPDEAIRFSFFEI